LKSKKLIASLFTGGSFLVSGSLRAKYVVLPYQEIKNHAQVAFSVPKSKFKNAVDRNYIKRLMRNAYRQHKYVLYEYLEEQKISMVLILMYQHHHIPDYSTLENDIITFFNKILERKLHS
jgi:ribonuclease P protein component